MPDTPMFDSVIINYENQTIKIKSRNPSILEYLQTANATALYFSPLTHQLSDEPIQDWIRVELKKVKVNQSHCKCTIVIKATFTF